MASSLEIHYEREVSDLRGNVEHGNALTGATAEGVEIFWDEVEKAAAPYGIDPGIQYCGCTEGRIDGGAVADGTP